MAWRTWFRWALLAGLIAALVAMVACHPAPQPRHLKAQLTERRLSSYTVENINGQAVMLPSDPCTWENVCGNAFLEWLFGCSCQAHSFFFPNRIGYRRGLIR